MPPELPRLQLVVHAGPLAGKGFPIKGETLTFGRDPENDITLDDHEVSRYHARLLRQGTEILVEDLGSTNGTLVNGKAITERHVLQPADIISIGSSVFGVKGFSAPSTVGITQVSLDKPPLPQPPPGAPASEPVAPAARPPSQPTPTTPAVASSSLSLLAIAGVMALVVVLVVVAGLSVYFLIQGRSSTSTSIPEVVITAPINGAEVQLNLPVTIQATASDPVGVTRMELWVSGRKADESLSPAPQGQPTLTASFQWVPDTPGTFTLEIRAYNERGAVSSPTVVTVNAVGDVPPDSADTPTPAADTPTPIPGDPTLTTRTDLNVRAGPGTAYDLLGLLPSGTSSNILGRSEDRQWWQIRFSPASDGVGWVSADSEFGTAENVANIPVVTAPATPTPTPTDTSTPTNTPPPLPTFTPTVTPTPFPTDTPTPVPGALQFSVSANSVEGGQCVSISWSVSGVREVYFQVAGAGETGVAGSASVRECPRDTTAYRLRVIRVDGSEQIDERVVEVVHPVESTGSIRIEPNQSIGLDAGSIPGDDFFWRVDGSTRRFERLDNARLAPMRIVNSLEEITRGECTSANYERYTAIEASDGINNPDNALVAGRAVCYRTNGGRFGKLRFPDYSIGGIRVEWLTWR